MDRWMDGWIAALGGGFVVVGCGEREGGERGERGFGGRKQLRGPFGPCRFTTLRRTSFAMLDGLVSLCNARH